jgi:hypothetical protein
VDSQVIKDSLVEAITMLPGLTLTHLISHTARTLYGSDLLHATEDKSDFVDVIQGLVRDQQIVELTYRTDGRRARTRYFPRGTFFSFKGKS